MDSIDIDLIGRTVQRILGKYDNIQALGLGIPGAVNEGIVVGDCDIESLCALNLKELLEDRFPDINIIIENDMNLKTLGFYEKQNYESDKNIVAINFPEDNCIGAGILINGKIVRGETSFAGEVSYQELLDIFSAGKRVEEKAREWLPLMDFSLLEEISDDLIEKGRKFFENVLFEFKNAGVDVEDPLQMIMVIKRFNPVKFEASFHPSVREEGHFSPYHPSVLGRSTIKQKEEIYTDLVKKGYSRTVKEKKIVAVSADGHSYGLMLIDELFRDLNADVINGGVDMEPASVLDLADEEGTSIIMISIHCGQVLDYCRQIKTLMESRKREYHIFVGGKLNSILPGHTKPVNVEKEIIKLGVHPSNDFDYLFDTLSKL